MSSKELLQKRTVELARIYAELARKDVEIARLRASIEDYKRQLVKRDSDDANENQRLRAALERCREHFRECGRTMTEKPTSMEQMCADALEGKP